MTNDVINITPTSHMTSDVIDITSCTTSDVINIPLTSPKSNDVINKPPTSHSVTLQPLTNLKKIFSSNRVEPLTTATPDLPLDTRHRTHESSTPNNNQQHEQAATLTQQTSSANDTANESTNTDNICEVTSFGKAASPVNRSYGDVTCANLEQPASDDNVSEDSPVNNVIQISVQPCDTCVDTLAEVTSLQPEEKVPDVPDESGSKYDRPD